MRPKTLNTKLGMGYSHDASKKRCVHDFGSYLRKERCKMKYLFIRNHKCDFSTIIRLIDIDGDGQVSFKEFYKMASG